MGFRHSGVAIMLSDVSDLSDSSHGGATQSKRKTTGYRLRNVLKPGRTTQYTAKALYGKLTVILLFTRPDFIS